MSVKCLFLLTFLMYPGPKFNALCLLTLSHAVKSVGCQFIQCCSKSAGGLLLCMHCHALRICWHVPTWMAVLFSLNDWHRLVGLGWSINWLDSADIWIQRSILLQFSNFWEQYQYPSCKSHSSYTCSGSTALEQLRGLSANSWVLLIHVQTFQLLQSDPIFCFCPCWDYWVASAGETSLCATEQGRKCAQLWEQVPTNFQKSSISC